MLCLIFFHDLFRVMRSGLNGIVFPYHPNENLSKIRLTTKKAKLSDGLPCALANTDRFNIGNTKRKNE